LEFFVEHQPAEALKELEEIPASRNDDVVEPDLGTDYGSVEHRVPHVTVTQRRNVGHGASAIWTDETEIDCRRRLQFHFEQLVDHVGKLSRIGMDWNGEASGNRSMQFSATVSLLVGTHVADCDRNFRGTD